MHYDETRFLCSRFASGVPNGTCTLDDLPQIARYTIEKAHRKAGFDGPIGIITAEVMPDGKYYRVVTVVRS